MRINDILTEAPLPDDWDSTKIAPNQTFKSRIQYAVSKANKLGTGSSRVAFSIPFEGRMTALKVAKNKKGLAQNSAEVSLLNDGYAKQLDILIPLIDYDDSGSEPVWIQTEQATPFANKAQLTNMLGVLSLEYLIALADKMAGPSPRRTMTLDEFQSLHQRSGFSDEEIDDAIEVANRIATLSHSYDLVTADLLNYKNWGIWDSRPVIIDLGLTELVRVSYYK